MTTGPEDRQHSAASVGTLADLAAGLQELTALAAGEVCAPAVSAVFMASVGSTEGGASLRESRYSKDIRRNEEIAGWEDGYGAFTSKQQNSSVPSHIAFDTIRHNCLAGIMQETGNSNGEQRRSTN